MKAPTVKLNAAKYQDNCPGSCTPKLSPMTYIDAESMYQKSASLPVLSGATYIIPFQDLKGPISVPSR
jgi:hypothetical protein